MQQIFKLACLEGQTNEKDHTSRCIVYGPIFCSCKNTNSFIRDVVKPHEILYG